MAYAKKKTVKRVARKRAPANNTKMVKLIRKVANATIHKAAEDKMATVNFPLTLFNSAANQVADQIRVFPQVFQGLNEADRVGQSITMKSLRIAGHFITNSILNDMPRSRMMVRMCVVQPKNFPNYTAANATTSWMNNILRNGNATQALDGSIESMYYPYNKLAVNVLASKKFILRSDYVATAVGGYQFACHFFNINLKIKNKRIKYDDTSSTPVGFAPIMLISYAYLDGSSPSVFTSISAAFCSNIRFEDI